MNITNIYICINSSINVYLNTCTEKNIFVCAVCLQVQLHLCDSTFINSSRSFSCPDCLTKLRV